MDFVALLSGGKDSCYNIHQCLAHGHRLVCLAHLSPPLSVLADEDCNEELHSFMYQSAGSSVIRAYEECLGVPLVIREITGQAVDQSLEYSGASTTANQTVHDEVEDLYQLLWQIKQQFPSIRGVSCGAIVSNYQRLRVEQVCERLNLTVLSYLWQRNRTELLSDLLRDGIDAILVKVAGAGLQPEKHLGKTLSMLYPTLLSLNKKLGLDLCGEGGEYESLVVDAPFFIKRIVIDRAKIFVDEEDCSVGNWKVLSYRLVEKESDIVNVPQLYQSLNHSLLLDFQTLMPKGRGMLTDMIQSPSVFELSVSRADADAVAVPVNPRDFFLSTILQAHPVLKSSSLLLPTQRSTAGEEETDDALIAQQQLRELLLRLPSEGTDLLDVHFVHLYLRNMSHFSAVNQEYCQHFGRSPPSRSCVSALLPVGCHVAMHVWSLPDYHRLSLQQQQTMRSVLHVKSLSSWAPLCIGPYAQCNAVLNGTLLFVAGQIPLDPSTMTLRTPLVETDWTGLDPSITLLTDEEREQQCNLLLCARHIAHVLNTQHSGLRHSLVNIVFLNSNGSLFVKAGKTCAQWAEQLRPLMSLLSREGYAYQPTDASTPVDVCGQDSLFADDFANAEQDVWDEESEERPSELCEGGPVVIVVAVPSLPRDAPVEVETLAMREGILFHTDNCAPNSHRQTDMIYWHRRVPFSVNPLEWLIDVTAQEHSLCTGSLSLVVNRSEEWASHRDVTAQCVVSKAWTLLLSILADKEIAVRASALLSVRIFISPVWSALLEKEIEIHQEDSCWLQWIQRLWQREAESRGLPTTAGVMCIPCSGLGASDQALMTVLFQAIDIPQVETVRWIARQ